jgi:N-dimethylarginine dimethylaminohydrolase
VFVANGGLALPRLQRPLVLLPSMKFPQRQAELPYLVEMYKEIGIPVIPFPTKDVFEGQAELKWFFGGNLAVCGPGHRSTVKSFKVLAKLFEYVYGLHGLDPPRLVITPLISADYYHLDVAMLEVNETTCIVHKRSMTPASIKALRAAGLTVHVIDTKDSFCLNAVISNGVLITHKLTDPSLAKTLKTLTGCDLIEVETTEFEKSGGSVRCMTLTV